MLLFRGVCGAGWSMKARFTQKRTSTELQKTGGSKERRDLLPTQLLPPLPLPSRPPTHAPTAIKSAGPGSAFTAMWGPTNDQTQSHQRENNHSCHVWLQMMMMMMQFSTSIKVKYILSCLNRVQNCLRNLVSNYLFTFLLPLSHRRDVATLSLLYCYFYGRCSNPWSPPP